MLFVYVIRVNEVTVKVLKFNGFSCRISSLTSIHNFIRININDYKDEQKLKPFFSHDLFLQEKIKML